jgi:hypothetical protein
MEDVAPNGAGIYLELVFYTDFAPMAPASLLLN